jgi:hypothetical protein
MKLTNADKLTASFAMLRGDSFTRGNATMFPFFGSAEYCVIQMIGPADKCKRAITASWPEALEKFEEYAC